MGKPTDRDDRHFIEQQSTSGNHGKKKRRGTGVMREVSGVREKLRNERVDEVRNVVSEKETRTRLRRLETGGCVEWQSCRCGGRNRGVKWECYWSFFAHAAGASSKYGSCCRANDTERRSSGMLVQVLKSVRSLRSIALGIPMRRLVFVGVSVNRQPTRLRRKGY